ncbi:MAG: LEA type 2 family protein [Leptospiraceae bacterium]|nr:LEA type 2 family protein [Leptospiraceae bacterium]MDW8307412.1 LEA type 2 family protein [Leptospiraceae bacterium]
MVFLSAWAEHRRKKTLLIFILLTGLGCGSLFRKVFHTPRVWIEQIAMHDLAFSGVTLIVDIAVENPNPLGVTLSNMKYKLFVENELLLQGERADKADIEAEKKKIFAFPLTLFYRGLRTGISGVIQKSALAYRFEGSVSLETPIGKLDFPLNREGSIPVPSLPRFHIEKVQLKELGLASATLLFHIHITNNEDFALDLERFSYRLALQGEEVSSLDILARRTLEGKQDMQLEIPVNLKFMNLRRGIIESVKSGKLTYEMEVNFHLNSKYGPYTLPYYRQALVSLY